MKKYLSLLLALLVALRVRLWRLRPKRMKKRFRRR